MFKICVYYNKKTEELQNFMPDISENEKSTISNAWEKIVFRNILKALSIKNNLNLSELKQLTNHSISTISDSITKLEKMGLVSVEIQYKEKKQKIIHSKILFVTENNKLKKILTQLLNQGIWINKEKSDEITKFLHANKDQYFSIEEISANTGIPIDEVKILLNNWESHITRAVSDFLKEPPFEKKILYKAK